MLTYKFQCTKLYKIFKIIFQPKAFFPKEYFYILYIGKLNVVRRLLCYINEVISIYFKIDFEKSLGKASSMEYYKIFLIWLFKYGKYFLGIIGSDSLIIKPMQKRFKAICIYYYLLFFKSFVFVFKYVFKVLILVQTRGTMVISLTWEIFPTKEMLKQSYNYTALLHKTQYFSRFWEMNSLSFVPM